MIFNGMVLKLFLVDPDDKSFNESKEMLQKLIQITCNDGCVYVPDAILNSKVLFQYGQLFGFSFHLRFLHFFLINL